MEALMTNENLNLPDLKEKRCLVLNYVSSLTSDNNNQQLIDKTKSFPHINTSALLRYYSNLMYLT